MADKNKKSIRQILSAEEISLVELIRLFYDYKKHVFMTTALFFVIGVLIALTSPYEYVAEARILSESGGGGESPSLGALSGLAGLAGISISDGSGGGGLSPGMYPEIASSEPFLLGLMQKRFHFQEKGKKMSLEEYFLEERPSHIFSKLFYFFRSLPGRFFALFERKKEWDIPTVVESDSTATEEKPLPKIVSLSNAQKFVITELDSRINIEAEERIISLTIKMPEPVVSAQLNSVVLNEIIQYVIAYQTEKQRENLNFIEERYVEAEDKFKRAQLRLAAFRDFNRGIVSQRAKAEEDRLQADFNLTFGIYSNLAQQLEETKIQLKKETPLFTEFEPVTIPLAKSEPNIPMTLIKWIIIGIALGMVISFVAIIRAYFIERSTVSAKEETIEAVVSN